MILLVHQRNINWSVESNQQMIVDFQVGDLIRVRITGPVSASEHKKLHEITNQVRVFTTGVNK